MSVEEPLQPRRAAPPEPGISSKNFPFPAVLAGAGRPAFRL